MDHLDIQGNNIQHTLNLHVAQSQEWQQNANAQFANINEQLRRQREQWDAFFRHQGYNPHQAP